MNSVFLELKFKMLKMSFLGYFINEISKTQKKKRNYESVSLIPKFTVKKILRNIETKTKIPHIICMNKTNNINCYWLLNLESKNKVYDYYYIENTRKNRFPMRFISHR